MIAPDAIIPMRGAALRPVRSIAGPAFVHAALACRPFLFRFRSHRMLWAVLRCGMNVLPALSSLGRKFRLVGFGHRPSRSFFLRLPRCGVRGDSVILHVPAILSSVARSGCPPQSFSNASAKTRSFVVAGELYVCRAKTCLYDIGRSLSEKERARDRIASHHH